MKQHTSGNLMTEESCVPVIAAYAVSTIILVHVAFPDLPSASVLVWQQDRGKINGVAVTISLDRSKLIQDLVEETGSYFLDKSFRPDEPLYIQWEESNDKPHFVNPMALPDFSSCFLQFCLSRSSFSLLHLSDIKVDVKKGTIQNQAPDSALPDFKSYFMETLNYLSTCNTEENINDVHVS